MRNKFGTFCMMLGTALLVAALSLFFYNQGQAAAAEQASMELMVQMAEQIRQRTEDLAASNGMAESTLETEPSASIDMTVVEIDGHGYIGYLSVPELELELPVMADWSYPKLKLAPCRYAGSVAGDDLVLMAHNYVRHFGGLSELDEGDRVVFTDMDGNVTDYAVVARDILEPTAVAEMTAGDFDLTLFTCTYGGQSRVTVYCDRVKNG